MYTVSITIERGDGGSEDRIEVERFEEADAVRDALRLLSATIEKPSSRLVDLHPGGWSGPRFRGAKVSKSPARDETAEESP